MSWRVAYRKTDQKYRLWSTISDDWLTKWGTKQEIQRYIAQDLLLAYKKQLIEIYLQFPDNLPYRDSEGNMRYMEDEAGYQAYGAWLKTLASESSDTYEELVETKYNEAVKALGL